MTTETILSVEKVIEIFESTKDQGPLTYARAIEQAVLQSEQVQALRDLLKEARQQLPLAAQFWNEDDDQDRSRRNVQHVMGLIKRIDAAMEQKK